MRELHLLVVVAAVLDSMTLVRRDNKILQVVLVVQEWSSLDMRRLTPLHIHTTAQRVETQPRLPR
jgi:hypothetical protein